jgi:hypothetical protein
VRILAGATLLAAVASGKGTKYDWQVTSGFEARNDRTWAWQEEARGPQTGPGAPDEPNGRLIVASIERHLAARGYSEAPVEAADLVVRYRTGATEHGDPRTPEPGYWTGFEGGMSSPAMVVKGAIAIELVDRESKDVVWLGIAHAVVKSQKQVPRRIDQAVSRLFERLPRQGD